MKQIKVKVSKKPKSIKQSGTRWVILMMACVVLMGDAFSFDNPQSLETQLEKVFGINQIQFNMFYSIYSVPNIILPLVGGYLIDTCGVRMNIVIFASLLILGQIIFTVAIMEKNFGLALFGRFIFGIGSECLTISQFSLVSYWFSPIELSLAVGLNLSLPRLGGACNSFLIPQIYDINRSLDDPMIFSTLVCFVCSFVRNINLYFEKQVGGLILVTIDKNTRISNSIQPELSFSKTPKANESWSTKPFENILELYPKYGVRQDDIETNGSSSANAKGSLCEDEVEKIVVEAPKFNTQSLMNIEKTSSQNNLVNKEEEKSHTSERVLLSDIGKLPKIFWLLLAISSLSESLFIPFLNNANKLYQKRFGFSNVGAGQILVVPYISACVFTPFIGLLMQFRRNSPRATYILVSSMFFLLTHLTFALIPNCSGCLQSIIPLVMLGLCFAVFASIIMPSVPIFINDERILGTAFGLAAIAQNLLLTIFPLASAQVYESVSSQSKQDNGFMYVSALFVGSSALLVGVSFILFINREQERKRKMKRTMVKNILSVRQNKVIKVLDDFNQHKRNSLPIEIPEEQKNEKSFQLEQFHNQSYMQTLGKQEAFSIDIKEVDVKNIFD